MFLITCMKVLILLWITSVFAYVPFCINCKHFKNNVLDKKYGTCKIFPIIKNDDYLVTRIYKPKPEEYHYFSTEKGSLRMYGER